MTLDKSSRAAALVEQLREVAEALIGLVASIQPEQWTRVPEPGVWSPGKDAEHVADGAANHQWTIRLTLGEKVPARPRIERARLTSERSQRDVVALLQQRTDESLRLISGLSDEELDLPVRPPRARSATLAQMIAAVLIGHYEVHRRQIEAKLRGQFGSVEQDLGANRPETSCQKRT